MKFNWKSYFDPTPKTAKQIGIAFKAIAAMGVPASLSGAVWLSVVLFGLGVAGEFLTNFFVEDKPQP